MSRWKKALHIISWIPIILLHIPLLALGFFVVPLALMMGPHSGDWHEIFWLWGNDEEGCPAWWYDVARTKGWFIKEFPCFWWYAVRNPVNNLRFIFKDRGASVDSNWWHDDAPMEAAAMIAEHQVTAYKWAWNGPFAGYRRVWLNDYGTDMVTYSELWVGWKIDSDIPGMGFTLQFRPYRAVGT